MAKIQPLPPASAQQSQEQAVQGPAAPPPADQLKSKLAFGAVAAISATSSPSTGGMGTSTHEIKTLAELPKEGIMFSQSGGGAKGSKPKEKVDKFRHELTDLDAILNHKATSEDFTHKGSKKLKELKAIIRNDLSILQNQLAQIHALERENPEEDVINSKFVSFEYMTAEQLVEYFNLRQQLAGLKAVKNKFAADPDPSSLKVMKDILDIPKLTQSDQKGIKAALTSSIDAGNRLVLDLIKIVQQTVQIVDTKRRMNGVAKASPAFEMLQQQVAKAYHLRGSSNVHYQLIDSEMLNMNTYQKKVDEIKARYTTCCTCFVM